MAMKQLSDLQIKGKRLLIREDLNVPIEKGQVTSDARIRAALPTLQMAVEGGATVMVMSHLGRPQEGQPIAEQPEASLAPVAEAIKALTGWRVRLVDDYLDGYEPGNEDIALFENIRINKGEKSNDKTLAKKLASLCDIYVMDAFGTAHRAQASTEGVIHFAPLACAGPLLAAELAALGKALSNPSQPMLAIVGGSKVSTKLQVLDALAQKVDQLIVGGGIANTFLAASGVEVGASLCEHEMLDAAKALLAKTSIPLPTDVVVATEVSAQAKPQVKPVSDIAPDEMILDLGPDTIALMCGLVAGSKTILWNGPVGVAELPAFAAGTHRLAQAIAASGAFSLAGGGDTLAVIDQLDMAERVSYISTGGGAFLEFVEGKRLPAVAALESKVN
ncbi:MAG: phosphoglycerate kinase [Pseudomonadales bacterium]